MSIIEEVLLEEYERYIRISKALEHENSTLPRGSIQKKHINNHDCYYLMFREDGKIKSQYIAESDVEDIDGRIKLRKENVKKLKKQEESRKKIEITPHIIHNVHKTPMRFEM